MKNVFRDNFPTFRGVFISLVIISLCSVAVSLIVNVTETESQYLTVYGVNKNFSSVQEYLEFNLSQAFTKDTVWFRESSFATIPQYLFKVFTAVRDLSLADCGIKSIKQGDFVNGSRLLKLDLAGNRIRSIPSAAFVLLTNLQRLDLAENELTALVSDTFHGLNELRDLFLDGNRIKSLPPNVFKPLISLEDISLNENPLGKLENDVFKYNEKLEEILLMGCYLRQVGREVFTNLKSLRVLNVARNSFDRLDLPSLHILHAFNSNLKECHINGTVKQVHIENNRLKIFEIADLSLIEELSLRNNSISDLNILRNASNLRKLDASNNPVGSISSDTFSEMRHLVQLELSNTYLYNIYHGTFSNLHNLFLLDLSRNHLNRLDVSLFADLKNLHVLYLEDNDLTVFDFEALEQARVRPRIYGLDGNNWNCEIVPHLIEYIEKYKINVKFKKDINANCTNEIL